MELARYLIAGLVRLAIVAWWIAGWLLRYLAWWFGI